MGLTEQRQATTALPEARPLEAAAWMAGAVASFTLMAVAGRAVGTELDTFELMVYRSALGVVVIGAIALAAGRTAEFRPRRMGLHLLRNVSHFAGQNLWFFAIGVAPLAQVIAVEFTTPLWVALLAPLLLGERLTPLRAAAAAAGFAGALIVANPSFDTVPPGLVAAAGAAIGFAGSALFTKILTRTESILAILFWLTLMQTAFAVLCAGYDGDVAVPSQALLPWIVVVGLTGLSAHLCLTRALSIAPATVVMPFDFARLPVVALVGIALYDEALELSVVLGAAVIIAANWVNLRASRRSGDPVSQG